MQVQVHIMSCVVDCDFWRHIDKLEVIIVVGVYIIIYKKYYFIIKNRVRMDIENVV